MTEDELLDDLNRLLREGLALLELDDQGDDPPRVRVTARGRAIVEHVEDASAVMGEPL